jgi:hypothetical protein
MFEFITFNGVLWFFFGIGALSSIICGIQECLAEADKKKKLQKEQETFIRYHHYMVLEDGTIVYPEIKN